MACQANLDTVQIGQSLKLCKV